MSNKRLKLEQLDRKLKVFGPVSRMDPPPSGWIKAIRSSLGMSLQQLADKLSITKQSVQEIESREVQGSITLKSLSETAEALDMQLVYGFVPKDGTIEALVERKARELATRIVLRTSNTMKLEDQENSKQRIRNAIAERTASIENDLPKVLWD